MTVSRGSSKVLVDADNTLWDTDALFADAQRKLLERVEKATVFTANAGDRLAYVRAIDQAIAERHHAKLRYPPRLLVRGLQLGLAGLPVERAARASWSNLSPNQLSEARVNEIEQDFFVDLSRTPSLRPGVRAGLEALQSAGCSVLIVTEEASAKVEATARRLEISSLVARIFEGHKQPQLYRRIARLTGERSHAFMVGDQLDRDIVPAKAAGLTTIYFPSSFRPRWTMDATVARPDHTISSFDEVPAIVLGTSGFNSVGIAEKR